MFAPTRLFAIACLFTPLITGAQTRIEKTGSNTWGGPYVPPVWSKTYDQTLKNYNIEVQSYRSGTRPAGTSTGSSGYTPKKSKWASIYREEDYAKTEARRLYKTQKAKEIILEYAKALYDGVQAYKAGNYLSSYNVLYQSLTDITVKGDKKYDNGDEVYVGLAKYYQIESYYKYMTGVKVGATENAVVLYNLNMATDYYTNNKGSVTEPDASKIYPFNPDLYYFLDPLSGNQKSGFNRYTLHERFMADLFLVELLVDLNRKEDAKTVFGAVLKFYLPRIDNNRPFLRQIAINHFYLGNTQEASDLLEYYWNETESYDDRMQVLNELLGGDGLQQKNKWSRDTYPEGYDFLKRNYLFLDSISTARNITIRRLSESLKYHLYVNRGNELNEYLSRMELRMRLPFDSLYANTHGYYNLYNPDVERYLRVLLKKKDKDKIRETLGRLAAVARKQQQYFLKQVDESVDNLDEFKHAPKVYWEAWYNRNAVPLQRALSLFEMKEFAEEGGKKYLREAAQPFIDEAEKFTEEEFTYKYNNLEATGIKPNFLKKRSYPDKAPPSKKELQAAAEQKQRDQETQNRIQSLESKRAVAASVPLSPEETRLNSADIPFGGLAIFELAVKTKQPAKGMFYDSATIDFATVCFARAGYEKGKSIRADILMASAAKDKAEIIQYLGGWKAEQLLATWYPGGIKTADQVPAGDDGMYEQQFIHLMRLAGSYEQLYTYLGKTSWKTAIKFAIEHAEAMALAGKFKEAFIFIENFSNYTAATRDKFVHWNRAVMMRAIVHFHKKEYKESWVHLNDYHVNINELLASGDKWKANLCGTAYGNPGIFIHDDYAYYYYCCASELKKKNILPYCLPLIDIPKTAPDWMVIKYGALFVKEGKQ